MDWIVASFNLSRTFHAAALLLFTALIPFFAIAAVIGIRKAAAIRLQALRDTYPALVATLSFQFQERSVSRVGGVRYVLPLAFLTVLNIFMSMLLLDGSNWTTTGIDGGTYYLLCGGQCADPGGNLNAYQTQTIIVAAFAFLGWMVWTFTAIFDRATSMQLFPSTFNRLVIRLAVAVLVAIVMRHLVAGDATITVLGPLPVLAFVIGMFPERGLSFIAQKFEAVLRAPAHSEDFPLDLIEGISPGLAFRMRELSVDSAADLAHANPIAVFEAAALPLSEIVDWIGQAQLLVLVKAARFQALQAVGFRTIFDIVRLLKHGDGSATLQQVCNLPGPNGITLPAIEGDSEYVRLLEVHVALGGTAP